MTTRALLGRLLREPLLHFLILGALLFALYGWLNRGALRQPDEIVVDQARVGALASQFQRVWQRGPSHKELQGLVDGWVRDEMLYREGIAVGLEREDDVVRRRVVQKVTSLNEGMAADVPTEAELQAWLAAHPDDYRIAPRYSLRQVYFDPLRHGDSLQRDMAAARERLQRDPHAQVGDASLLPAGLVDAPADEVERTLGTHFVKALTALPEGQWSGPIESGFGSHLVWIDSHTPGAAPTLAQVRREVERDLLNARNREANEAFLDVLKKRYTVTLEADLASAGQAASPAVSSAAAGAR